MLTGGEPTLHADLTRIISLVTPYANQVVLITNGVRISKDLQYLAELKAASDKLHVYLQFDSLRPEALVHLRGKDLSEVRQLAVKNLELLAIPTTLVSVVKQGINDSDLVATVEFAVTHRHVLGVTFQPIRAAGRHSDFDYSSHHITLTGVRRLLLDGLGLPDSALRPHPADPFRVSIGYFCRDSKEILTDEVWNGHARRDIPLYADVKDPIYAAADHRPFRITVVSYYDQHDMVLEPTRPSEIVFLSDDGSLVTLESRFLSTAIDSPAPQPIFVRKRV